MRRRIALALAALLLATPLVATGGLSASASPGNFQDNPSSFTLVSGMSGAGQQVLLGQIFTAKASGTLEGITLGVFSYGGYAEISFQGVTNGVPDQTNESYGYTYVLTGSEGVGTSDAAFFALNPAPTVVAGQQYMFALTYNFYNVFFNTSGRDAYSGGTMMYFNEESSQDWTTIPSDDINFTTQIDVDNYEYPSIAGTPPAANLGVPYNFAYTLGGYPSPYTSITSGSLPAGLTLSSNGVISGTPTTAGTRSFTVKGDNFYAETINSTIVVNSQKPDAPPAPTVAAGSSAVVVTVTPPTVTGTSPITSYRATLSSGSSCNVNLTTRTCTIFAAYGSAYTVTVTATNASGTSLASPASASVSPYTLPGTPGSVAASMGNGQSVVTWDAAAPNGAAVTNYETRYATTGTTSWVAGPTTSSFTTTLSSLSNGTSYDVQVRAQNAAGFGPWSSSATTWPGTTPSAPQHVAVHERNAAIELVWDASATDGGRTISYLVQHRAAGASAWIDSPLTSSTTKLITGLTNGSTYEFRVTAVNALGQSAAVSATGRAHGAPITASTVTLVRGDAALAASWDAASDQGSGVTGYLVFLRESGTSTWDFWDGVWGPNANIAWLSNGVAYDVRVQAYSSDGLGNYSNISTETPGAVPAVPSGLTATPSDESVDLDWTAPDDRGFAIEDYEVNYRAVGAADWINLDLSYPEGLTVSSLDNGTLYEFRVRATNELGFGDWSALTQAMPRTMPDAPEITSVVGCASCVSAEWDAAVANGTAVTGYELEYRASGATTWLSGGSTGATNGVISSLTDGTAYEVRIRATSAVGPSDWATFGSAVTAGEVSTAPQSLAATAGSGSVDLDWQYPADDGGAEVDHYELQYRLVGGLAWIDLADEAGLSTTVGSLTNGSAHELRVRAVNGVGAGPWSTITATPWVFEPHFESPSGTDLDGTSLKPGDTVVVSGDGALPGETVRAELHSTPVVLGSGVVNGVGSFSFTVTIPLTAPAGTHSLVAYMGSSVAAPSSSVGVTVLAADELVTSGTDASGPIGAAVLALLVGGFLVIRRRRTAQ